MKTKETLVVLDTWLDFVCRNIALFCSTRGLISFAVASLFFCSTHGLISCAVTLLFYFYLSSFFTTALFLLQKAMVIVVIIDNGCVHLCNMLKTSKFLSFKGGKGKSGDANLVTSEGQASTSLDIPDQEIILYVKTSGKLIISLQNET